MPNFEKAPKLKKVIPEPKTILDSFRDAFRNKRLVGLIVSMGIIANCEGKCHIFSKETVACSCVDGGKQKPQSPTYNELKEDKDPKDL